ncbi:hypothetical protein MTBUT4_230041 [Magnetospirillum sp. UT-4]|nr:hypothetical protein MTBUT4_230041 [Magnetospirillum sp. UT-4]
MLKGSQGNMLTLGRFGDRRLEKGGLFGGSPRGGGRRLGAKGVVFWQSRIPRLFGPVAGQAGLDLPTKPGRMARHARGAIR